MIKKGIINRFDATVRFLVRQNVTTQQKKQQELARHAATPTKCCVYLRFATDYRSVLDSKLSILTSSLGPSVGLVTW